MSMVRSVDQWKQILAAHSPTEAARRVMGDLTHYYHGRPYEEHDCQELANAMDAWRQLERKP